MQTHALPSVEVLLARKAKRGATERRVVEASADSASSPSSSSEGSEESERVRCSGSVEKERTYRMGRWQMMRAGEVGAISRTLQAFLLDKLKVHRIQIACIQCVVE